MNVLDLLVVEDDADFLTLLRKGLLEKGETQFRIISANRLKLALQKMEARDFDVILLDLNLPDSAGLGTFTKIHRAAPLTPVVILSGLDDEATALQAIRNGAHEYCLKGSLDGRMLKRILCYSIERKRAEEAMQKGREEEQTRISREIHDLLEGRNLRLRENPPSFKKGATNIKVLIADDHAVVRAGLKQILSEQPDFGRVQEACNAREVLEAVRKEKWDILILDIALPDKSGLDLLKELRVTDPDLPVLILSIYPEDQYALRALKAGASGYLTKEYAADRLVAAIHKVVRGGRYISPNLADKIAMNLGEKEHPEPLHESLSDREFQILCLIAAGKKPKEIARQFCLSVKTIGTYRERILRKMKMRSSAELVRYAVQNGIVK